MFEIHIQNFSSYYFAIVISGDLDRIFKSKLEYKLFDIASHIKYDVIDKEKITIKLK